MSNKCLSLSDAGCFTQTSWATERVLFFIASWQLRLNRRSCQVIIKEPAVSWWGEATYLTISMIDLTLFVTRLRSMFLYGRAKLLMAFVDKKIGEISQPHFRKTSRTWPQSPGPNKCRLWPWLYCVLRLSCAYDWHRSHSRNAQLNHLLHCTPATWPCVWKYCQLSSTIPHA